MKIISLILSFIFVAAQPINAVVMVGFGTSAFVGITDDFSADLSKWTSSVGTWSISSGALSCANTEGVIEYTQSSVTTENQWIKVAFPTTTGPIIGVIFRSPGALGNRYSIQWREVSNRWDWIVVRENATYVSGVALGFSSGSYGDPAGQTMGFTLTGTGTSAVAYVFANPVAANPISATSWDSTDDYAGYFSSSGASTTVDSGTTVGLYIDAAGGSFDNFSAGDL